MEEIKIKELEEMLKEDDGVLPIQTKDFRKLQVVYLCLADTEEAETNCISYSPGPGGRCSHKDFSFYKPVCKFEE